MNFENMTAQELIQKLQQFQESDEEKISIIELGDEYLAKLRVVGRTKHTRQVIRTFLDRWFVWTSVHQLQYAHEVKRKHGIKYYEHVEALVRNTTAQLEYRYLKAMFNYGIEMGYVFKNPFFLKFKSNLKVHDDYWDVEYYNSLINAIKKHGAPSTIFKYELITRLLFCTGIRIGKLKDVTKDGIKFIDDDTVTINSTRKTISTTEVTTHTFYLKNKKAIEMLILYLKRVKGNRLFGTGNDISYRRMLKKNICPKANIEYRNPHQAKHGFITHLAKKGVTAEMVCALTGNSNIELVRKTYTHFTVKEVADKTAHLLKDL